jgi:hypothetical protein
MESSPPEICHKIFTEACLDDGSTARSLSLVSKYIHEASNPTRFQNIALRGYKQITAFADILGRTPPHLRRVCHLFISSRNLASTEKVYMSGSSVMMGAPWRENDLYGRNIFEQERLFQQEKSIFAAIDRILLLIAPTVETLALFFTYEWRSVLLSLSLPNLTELTIRGSYFIPETKDAPLVLLPSLRYLHIGERRQLSAGLMQYISKAAPSLTHVRFTGCRSADNLGAISPTVANILIQLCSPQQRSRCATSYFRELDHIRAIGRRILEQSDGRIMVLTATSGRESEEEVLQQWLERANGGQGCWTEDGQTEPIHDDRTVDHHFL